ncbi:hypothetical protein G9A89_016410 [Geosiphon pyriformis]|nr:hypothetical protein G9A89_016410 [Geosiphon pyriformis]
MAANLLLSVSDRTLREDKSEETLPPITQPNDVWPDFPHLAHLAKTRQDQRRLTPLNTGVIPTMASNDSAESKQMTAHLALAYVTG